MAFEPDKFTRLITDSKYQFSVGTVVALMTVFPADWKLMVCVTVIAACTIIAEGLRDVARWTPAPRPVDKTEPGVNLDVTSEPGGSVTTIKREPVVPAQQGTTHANQTTPRPRY
jgi:hypothetical protein